MKEAGLRPCHQRNLFEDLEVPGSLLAPSKGRRGHEPRRRMRRDANFPKRHAIPCENRSPRSPDPRCWVVTAPGRIGLGDEGVRAFATFTYAPNMPSPPRERVGTRKGARTGAPPFTSLPPWITVTNIHHNEDSDRVGRLPGVPRLHTGQVRKGFQSRSGMSGNDGPPTSLTCHWIAS